MADLIDPHHTRRDLRQVETAIKKGWKIPDQIFEQAAIVIGKILASGADREKIAAARVLVAMNAQNNPVAAIGTTINVGVNVENNTVTGAGIARSIVEQIRAEESAGGGAG